MQPLKKNLSHLYRIGRILKDGPQVVTMWLDTKSRWIDGSENGFHPDVWDGTEAEADRKLKALHPKYKNSYIVKVCGGNLHRA